MRHISVSRTPAEHLAIDFVRLVGQEGRPMPHHGLRRLEPSGPDGEAPLIPTGILGSQRLLRATVAGADVRTVVAIRSELYLPVQAPRQEDSAAAEWDAVLSHGVGAGDQLDLSEGRPCIEVRQQGPRDVAVPRQGGQPLRAVRRLDGSYRCDCRGQDLANVQSRCVRGQLPREVLDERHLLVGVDPNDIQQHGARCHRPERREKNARDDASSIGVDGVHARRVLLVLRVEAALPLRDTPGPLRRAGTAALQPSDRIVPEGDGASHGLVAASPAGAVHCVEAATSA
mmetsp:Transcript_99075/g.284680  ORF Transcript_99075/g.284680 Transcript_99075/m.284680 type:complete len:286 (-) Transcript_99075:179-1036(-)